MKVAFSKYHGCGNDFIIIDNRELNLELSEEEVKFLCHRRFGIGADGLILFSEKEGYDFEMVYYNSDGKTANMCGNGGRSIVAFAHKLGFFEIGVCFWAADGEHHASFISQAGANTLINLQMKNVDTIEQVDGGYVLNTGVPHYICFAENVADLDVAALGKTIRHEKRFIAMGGVNVNFVEIKGDGKLFVRTYERGVENETYSCGTGVTAAALVYGSLHNQNHVDIKTLGGNLSVNFKKTEAGKFRDIFLQAQATEVFNGSVEIRN